MVAEGAGNPSPLVRASRIPGPAPKFLRYSSHSHEPAARACLRPEGPPPSVQVPGKAPAVPLHALSSNNCRPACVVLGEEVYRAHLCLASQSRLHSSCFFHHLSWTQATNEKLYQARRLPARRKRRLKQLAVCLAPATLAYSHGDLALYHTHPHAIQWFWGGGGSKSGPVQVHCLIAPSDPAKSLVQVLVYHDLCLTVGS